MSVVLTALALYFSWRLLRRVILGLVVVGMVCWRAAGRLVPLLWQLEQRRRDRAAIEALLTQGW